MTQNTATLQGSDYHQRQKKIFRLLQNGIFLVILRIHLSSNADCRETSGLKKG